MRKRFYENQLFLFQKMERRKKRPPHLPYKRRAGFDPYSSYPQKPSFSEEVFAP